MCPSDRIVQRTIAVTSEFRSAFDVLDADRDGKISGDDLRMFYAGFSDCTGGLGDNDAVADEVIGTMISVADSNKDGFVEYDEFERVLRGYSRNFGYNNKRGTNNSSGGGDGGVMEDVFRVMDKDGDGRLSLDDLKSYMDWAGFCASDEDIKAMITVAGGDDKEGVSFDGLLKIFGC